MGTLIIVGLIALIVIVFALSGLKIIRQGETKSSKDSVATIGHCHQAST